MESKMAPTNRILATLLLMVMVLLPSISALPRDAELSIDFVYPQPSGNITNEYINNTFINQTANLTNYYIKAYGVSTSSASTNAKSVTIANYTPVAGDIIAIKFTYGSTASSNWDLAINGVWYYDVWVGGSTATADYLLFSANAVVLLYYDGTKMSVINPTYTNPLKWITLAGTTERPVETIYGYKLAWKDGNNRYRPIIKTTGTTGNNDMPNTAGFMLGSNMVINSGGTTYGTSTTMAKDFNLIGDIGTAYNFNSAFTAWLPVYFKGTVNQTDGLFYLNQANGYTGWYTQTLPTSEDGFVYVYVGNAWTTTGIGLSLNHPAYEFKDGMIRLYGEAKNDHQDNFKEYFGTGKDASIHYDGTNLVINPKEVGNGVVRTIGRNVVGPNTTAFNAFANAHTAYDTVTGLLAINGNYAMVNPQNIYSYKLDYFDNNIVNTLVGDDSSDDYYRDWLIDANSIKINTNGGTGDVVFGTNIKINKDNGKLYFGTDVDSEIYYDGTNLVFNTSKNGSGLAYFSNNVSADYYFGNASYMTGIPAPDLSGLVPYTGATSNVDLNKKNLSNVSLVNVSGNIINTGTTTADGLVSTGKFTINGITGGAGDIGSAISLTSGQGGAGSTGDGGAAGGISLLSSAGGATTIAGKTGGAASTILIGTTITTGKGGTSTITGSGTNTGGVGTSIRLVGGEGGAASGATNNVGGAGGSFTLTAKAGGGTVSAAGTNATGGASGSVSFIAARGGAANGGGTNVGGAGGGVTFQGGSGGITSGGTSNTGGAGGTITFQTGVGGTGSTSAGANGNILFKVGTTESCRIDGATQNFWFNADNRKSVWGAGQDASIYYDGTNLVFNTSESGSGLAYFSNNVSATGYITRTSIFDKSKGTALNYIKDASEYLYAKGDINHKAFYGYVEQKVTDFSRPVIDYLPKEDCSFDKEDKQVCSIIYEPITTYPYTKIEDGVDLGKEIDVLRQAVYELKMELEKVKSETCTIKLFSWCIK